MTWVETAHGDPLDLQDETYALWRLLLQRTWDMTDPALLELSRTRMMQLYNRAPNPREQDVDRENQLARWWEAEEFTDEERDVLAYVEQWMIDQTGLTEKHKSDLARRMSQREISDFTFALYTHDADLRARTLLDIDVAAPAINREDVDVNLDLHLFPFPGVDATYGELLGRFGNDAVRRSQVDQTTDELCRLRNASHQQCHF